MKTPEPVYPSFPYVLTYAEDSLRLPAYRTGHAERFHPYPRSRRSLDRMMQTVDYRELERPVDSVPPVSAGAEALIRTTEAVDCLKSAPLSSADLEANVANLDLALHADFEAAATGRRKLATLIIDLAFAVRRHYQADRRLEVGRAPGCRRGSENTKKWDANFHLYHTLLNLLFLLSTRSFATICFA
ncbi:hypothetical protein CERSUDRAFT_113424, partial [Gelatoporia subvermispora B]